METKKILGIIFSIIFVCAFGFCLTWTILNWNKVKDGMSGTGLYTSEDLENSYQDGYNTALENKEEYETLISGYRDTITTLTDRVSNLNSQITTLTNSNTEKQNQITNLTNIKTQNENTITSLNSTISLNNSTIDSLDSQIDDLNDEITILENTVTNNQTELTNKQNSITSLTNQVTTLQSLKTQLEQTNQSNINTISTLNAQIVSLNSQISSLNLQIQNNSNNVSALNSRISELETSIAYYEQYISSLQSSNQVVATFEYDGSVYNIQILSNGAIASVTNPTSTTYKVFNGWKVNNSSVNLSTYEITQNTTFVADITYKYDVTFTIDNATYVTQIITSGNYATLPTTPTKSGYQFDGWTIDGTTIVNVSANAITSNTTYIAKFTKLYTATFMYENTTLSTQTIRNGNYATSPTVANTTYKVFNGWKVNNSSVDLSTYSITADTTFVADITYKYDVTFTVDNTTYDTQIVTSGNYATLPTTPTKSGYTFDGWSINGTDIINVSTNVITNNTIYVGLFTRRIGLENSTATVFSTCPSSSGTFHLDKNTNNYYFICNNTVGQVYIFNSANNTFTLKYEHECAIKCSTSASFIYSGYYYFSDNNKNMYKLSLTTFNIEQWFDNSTLGSSYSNYYISSLQTNCLDDGFVYLVLNDYVFKYDFNTGTINSIKSLGTQYSWCVIDDYLFYTSSSNKNINIYIMSTRTSKKIYSSTTSVCLSGVYKKVLSSYTQYMLVTSNYLYYAYFDSSGNIQCGTGGGSSTSYFYKNNATNVNDTNYTYKSYDFGTFDTSTNTFTKIFSSSYYIDYVLFLGDRFMIIYNYNSSFYYYNYWI